MIAHKRIGLLAGLLMAAAVLLLGAGFAAPDLFDGVSAAYSPPYVTVMENMEVLDIQIIVKDSDWADMLANAQAKEYIPATVIINGVKIKNAGIRPKGNSSLSAVARNDSTDRFSFKIEFDHYVNGQSWLGLDKLALNNMHGDASYMKEYLAYDLMREAGVATPVYTFCNISVNGELWGFYLAIEALEDSYAKRYFGNDHGKLYKPEAMGIGGDVRIALDVEGNAQAAPQRIQGGAPQFFTQQEQPLAQQGQQPDNAPGQRQVPDNFSQVPDNTSQVPDNLGQVPDNFSQAPDQNSPNPRPAGQAPVQQTPAQGEAPQRQERNEFMGLGGFGSSSGGAALLYSDDAIASYAAIFDNAAFDISDADRHRLIAALKKLNDGEDLDSVVDVDATLRYFAAHAVLVNLDSYVTAMSHNYYLYEKNGQLTMLPWDFNLAFGGFQSGDASSVVNFPIDTPVSGVSMEDRPILGRLLDVPEYMALYHSYLQALVDDYFNSGHFERLMDALDALIAPHVQADPSAFFDYAAYQSAVTELKKLGLLRAESIAGQLDGSIPATAEAQRVNPAALVDAADLDMSALGSGGGMIGFAARADGEGNFELLPAGGAAAFDAEDMQLVMELLQEAGEEGFTPEQQAQLDALGITEEQLAMFRRLPQGADGTIVMPGRLAGGMGVPVPQNGAAATRSAGYRSEQWIVLGGCALLMLLGLLFAVLFRRRRI